MGSCAFLDRPVKPAGPSVFLKRESVPWDGRLEFNLGLQQGGWCTCRLRHGPNDRVDIDGECILPHLLI